MPLKCFLLLLFCLGSRPGWGQSNYLQTRLEGILNVPQVKILENTGSYEIRSGRPLAGFKIGYSHFNPRNLGYSVGLQLIGKQYLIYQERRLPTAELQSSTRPRYYTYSLPLAFEYRGNPFLADGISPYRKRFFSLSAGVALAHTKETSIRVRYRGAGTNFHGSLRHTDDFSLASVWGYEIFLRPAYNFWFQNGSYLGIGPGFTYSPAKYVSLNIQEERDGQPYTGSFQPKALNYLSFSISYHLPIHTGSK